MRKQLGPFCVDQIDGIPYLYPFYAREKSFYKKAKIYFTGSFYRLISYDTCVATFDAETGVFSIEGYYSQTTKRHQQEFARQVGIFIGGKHELEQAKTYSSSVETLTDLNETF